MTVYYINSMTKNLTDFSDMESDCQQSFINLSLNACNESYIKEGNQCITDKWSLFISAFYQLKQR